MFTFLLLFLSSLALFLAWLVYRENNRPANAPPLVKTGIPIFGPAAEFSKDPPNFLLECQKKYGDVFEINLLMLRAVFFLERDLQKEFFKVTDTNLSFEEGIGDFAKGVSGANPFKLGFDNTLAYVGVKDCLHPKRLDFFHALIKERARSSLNKACATKTPVDLVQLGDDIITFCSVECLVGKRLFAEKGEAIAEAFRLVEMHGSSPLAIITAGWPVFNATREPREKLFQIIADEYDRRISDGSYLENDDYLSVFMQHMQREQPSFQKSHTVFHFLNILVAAHTNTAFTFIWTIAHLLAKPECLRQVVEEQEQWSAKYQDQSDGCFEKQKELTFLDYCMKETVRLHAPATSQRKSTVDFDVAGYHIPKGTYVMISPLALHQDPRYFENPQEFNPSRFKQDFGYAFSQFGFGKHRCLGASFANTMLKTCWSLLFREYDLSFAKPDFTLPKPDYTKMIGSNPPASAIPILITRKTA